MKNSTLWTVVIVVIIVLAMGAFIMVAYHSAGSLRNSAATAPTSTIVSYICDNKKIIAAEFGANSMTMAVSDGRSFVLSEIASSSRYEEGSGTSQDVVFVDGSSTAYLMENGSTTYSNCIMNTTSTQTSSAGTTG